MTRVGFEIGNTPSTPVTRRSCEERPYTGHLFGCGVGRENGRKCFFLCTTRKSNVSLSTQPRQMRSAKKCGTLLDPRSMKPPTCECFRRFKRVNRTEVRDKQFLLYDPAFPYIGYLVEVLWFKEPVVDQKIAIINGEQLLQLISQEAVGHIKSDQVSLWPRRDVRTLRQSLNGLFPDAPQFRHRYSFGHDKILRFVNTFFHHATFYRAFVNHTHN